jgi:polysaccharide export outer membrane protein
MSLLMVVAATPVAHAQRAQGDAPRSEPTAAAGSAKIMLRPGDRIRLRIWREPDLSGEFPVSEAGVITIPKLGPIEVLGRDPDSLRSEIVAGYSKYLVNSSLEVVFVHRVQVLGEVRNPNLYYADETMTVGDVLALAGGVTDRAKLSRLELIRAGQRVPFTLTQNTVIGESAIRSGDQILVPQKGWIARNPGTFVAALTTAASLAVTVLLRHR